MAYSFLGIFANIGLVGGSIVVFAAPFIAVFIIRHRVDIVRLKPGFNQFIERFLGSPALNWLVLFWALAEALVWFVIPEFLLLLVVFMKVRHRANLLVYDVIGTVIGTLIGLAIHLPRDFMIRIPYVYDGMFVKVQGWFGDMGVWGLINQPFSGVPYKVFLSVAPEFGFNVLAFILLALVLRIGRYAIFYAVFRLAYPALHRFVYRHYAVLLSGAIVIFSLLLMRVSSQY